MNQREFLEEKERTDGKIEMIRKMLVELDTKEQMIDRETKKKIISCGGL